MLVVNSVQPHLVENTLVTKNLSKIASNVNFGMIVIGINPHSILQVREVLVLCCVPL